MPSEVRVHLRLGSFRLEFRGEQSFYEKHVESLVAAAAASGDASTNGSVHVTSAPPAAPPPARSDAGESSAKTDERAPQAAPGVPAFVPQAGELGRFIRRLGPEAGEPDRQIVALAFYLWNYEKKESFGAVELLGCYKAMGMKGPDGLDAILADLTDRRRFLEASVAGAWKLSRKGENYVKTRLLLA